CLPVPDLNPGLRFVADSNQRAVATEGEGLDATAVSGNGRQLLQCADIPDLKRSIAGTARQPSAVSRERQPPGTPPLHEGKCCQRCHLVGVPDQDVARTVSCRKPATIGRDSE